MRKTRTFGRAARGLLAATLTLGIAAHAADAKTLRIGSQADAGTMDPQAQNIQTTITVLSWIYEPLVTRDKSLAKAPLLALSWSQPDATTWRFRLRPDVTFADGTPFTAADVAFTVDRAQKSTSQFNGFVAGLKVRPVDDLTVDIITPRPDPLLPDKMIYIPIMSKAWAEKNNALVPQDLTTNKEAFTALHANGTGPYVLQTRTPDSKTVFTRNPKYWGKMDGDIDEVDFLPIANDATRIAALLSKQVDLVTDVPAQDVARLQQNPDVKLEKAPEFRSIFFGFDLGHDTLKYADAKGNPFRDLRVRQAMDMAVDRDAIVRAVMRGLASPTDQILSPNNVGYVPALDKGPARNIAEAKKLLADAGYPDGFAATMDCPNDRYVNDEQVCKTVITMLSQIGLKITLDSMPRAKFFPKVWERDTSFYMMGVNSPYFDGMYALETMIMTRNDKAGEGIYNYENYSNPALDHEIAAARGELDPAKRAQMIAEIYRKITKDVLYVSLYNQMLVYAMQPGVTVPIRPDNWLEIRWVTMN